MRLDVFQDSLEAPRCALDEASVADDGESVLGARQCHVDAPPVVGPKEPQVPAGVPPGDWGGLLGWVLACDVGSGLPAPAAAAPAPSFPLSASAAAVLPAWILLWTPIRFRTMCMSFMDPEVSVLLVSVEGMDQVAD